MQSERQPLLLQVYYLIVNPETHQVVGFGEVEEKCREIGLGIIHGGQNALRFTPHFEITSEEVNLVINLVRTALLSHQH